MNERSDGLDTLNWLQNEAWVKNIGYWGNSYLALTGWCIADAVPSKVKGMYLGVYGTDRFTSAYSKGLFRHDVLTSWAMENAGFPVISDYLESCRFMPHCKVDESLWGQKIPWYRQWITATREDDEYWQQGFWKMLKGIPSKVKIPLLITDAWYDHHLGSAIKSYEMLGSEALEKTTLIVGCWNHYSENCIEWDEPKNLQNSEVSAMAEWFRMLLMEEQIPERRVRTYIVGADEWKEYKTWPMPVKGQKMMYLNAGANCDFGKAFLLSESSEDSSSAEFIYDPQNPVPSLGGESMLHSMNKVGSMYQPEPGFREDVLTFISAPVEEAFTIAGKMRVHLHVSTDCDDTAFTAKIMEVREDGTSVNIRSSITTIVADVQEEAYTSKKEADDPEIASGKVMKYSDERYIPGSITEVCVDMWDIAWKVQKGSRIRVDISSSDFPQYSIHSNYAGVWSKQEKTRVAHQTIYCGGEYASYLEIPLLDE